MKLVLGQCSLRGCYAGSRHQLATVLNMIQQKKVPWGEGVGASAAEAYRSSPTRILMVHGIQVRFVTRRHNFQISGPPITRVPLDDVENRMKEMIAGSTYRGRYVAEMNQP